MKSNNIIGAPAFAEWWYISFTELNQIRIPPGIKVNRGLFDPPFLILNSMFPPILSEGPIELISPPPKSSRRSYMTPQVQDVSRRVSLGLFSLLKNSCETSDCSPIAWNESLCLLHQLP